MIFDAWAAILKTTELPEGEETPAVFVMNGVFWRTDAVTRLGRMSFPALASPLTEWDPKPGRQAHN